ncbi:MAG: bacillithiol biosynthesis deacetylase BshB1 [Vicinamibacterales bacterium]|jgi:bacillithiol biosynthesis deacetylase BshB1|nr:bacillithiol biosynthesis deacetylase BshB1 [Acidobacteriota bacterium]MDP7294128.1 bacillithiol biosynthesis deacetylase BshB1 [Vicinamibacterales bacterium]MDP7471699.1 bacillithiol biosynthesis deacetylase BshB1 [Vicinamibacterales bacterium]MDP7671613.1 bacillithiol biosynthesis deacetylase BshB1 [Vicinamibacterales bacterium]HJO37055.1 bacillithiol biosynthesis deacetylase BshB1 [Vicinamibacterales bacterium]|tara:strand:+ start:3964 stop:4680 length:717 start_codon:yes stop_codon:yes gene_type:complete
MQVDVLAFGPHPDDIEIGLGGTLAKHARAGDRVGLCDLTRGELGSNGTVEVRLEEAQAAARVLGASWRENLGLPDGGLRDDSDQVRAAAEFIRRCRPRTVAAPYGQDRHPDHAGGSRLVTAAVFAAGLRRAKIAGEPWRPNWVCHYFINDTTQPSFVVDVSAHYETKRQALRCHASQFEAASDTAVATRLNAPSFLRLVESRDEHFGARLGVAFAEGFVVTEPIVRQGLLRDEGPETP